MCPRRFPLFALSLFLALSLFPSRALAYDFIPKGLVYSADLDGSRFGAVAVAANQFDAACYALGKEPASISTSIRSKLSDSNYGGRFYEFSQAFYTQGWPLEHVPDWLPAYVWGSVELNDFLLSDYQSVWYVTCTQSLRAGALVDFLAVLNGEDLSGGGNDPADISGGLPDSILLDTLYGNAPNNKYGDTFRAPSGSYTVNFTDKATVLGKIQAVGGRYLYAVYMPYFMGGGIQRYSSNVYFLTSESPITFSYTPQTSTYRPLDVTGVSSSTIYLASVGGGTPVLYKQYPPTIAGSCSVSSLSFSSVGLSYTLPNSKRDANAGGYQICSQAATTSAAPVVAPPAGTWPEPETPPTPTAPVLPEPVTPTVTPEPTVTDPTPTWPVIPTPTAPTVTLTDTPSGLDYTQLLTLINDNLNDINSYTVAINSNFNSLRSDLVTEFDSVVQALRNIYQYLQHFDNLLERHCVHLQNKMEDVSVDIQNKMRELVHWLADELDFDSEESGNSSLFGILSTINDKLGGGTYEPNPLKSEDSYYEWLDDLWDRFLLGDDWQSSVSGISSSFGQLKTRFPFSVPWDIVALFRLFVHDPVTPEFDLPLYFSPDSSTPVHVDLSAWDDVASIVRPLVYVIFALKLALLSRDLLGGLGADKGGL